MIEKLISSKYLYPLWRIGWVEWAFFRVCKLFGGTQNTAFTSGLFGFDISKWQGVVDFLKMQAYGTKFLILRCAYGIRVDERFVENIAKVSSGLPVSVYHYYDPIYDPVDQASKVIATLAPYKGRIHRVWLDLEFSWNGTYSAPSYWKIYRDIIKLAGYKVGWYTRATWWDSRVGAYAAQFAVDPLWAAQYNTSLTLIPRGWTKAMVWQKGTPSVGSEAGVSSEEIDLDLWNDEFNFVAEWGTPISEGDDDMTEEQITRIVSAINSLTASQYAINETLKAIPSNGGGTTPPPPPPATVMPSRTVTFLDDANHKVATWDQPDETSILKCALWYKNTPQETAPPISIKGMPKRDLEIIAWRAELKKLFAKWAYLPRFEAVTAGNVPYSHPDKNLAGTKDMSALPGSWVYRNTMVTPTDQAWIDKLIAYLEAQR